MVVRACTNSRIITAYNRGKAIRGRKRIHLLCDLMKGKYVVFKRTDEDRKDWQRLLRAGSYNLLLRLLAD